MAKPPAPTLIERSLVLENDHPESGRVEELVAFQRNGQRLLLVAPKPKRWQPTRNTVDRDLKLQQKLHHQFSRAGAELDGVLYLGTGLFSRRQSQKNEFARLARRYDRTVSELVLIAADPDLLDAMIRSGGQAVAIGDGGPEAAKHFTDLAGALASVKFEV